MSPRKTKLLDDLRLQLDLSDRNKVDISDLLAKFAQAMGGTWCAYWLVDEASTLLRFSQDWCSAEFNRAVLDDQIQKRTFSPGEGMPGTVWRTKKAAWSRDIVKDMMLPRSLRALDAGLETGVWIPIINQGKIIGIVEILGCRIDILVNELSDILQTMGQEIGERIV